MKGGFKGSAGGGGGAPVHKHRQANRTSWRQISQHTTSESLLAGVRSGGVLWSGAWEHTAVGVHAPRQHLLDDFLFLFDGSFTQHTPPPPASEMGPRSGGRLLRSGGGGQGRLFYLRGLWQCH